MAKNKEFPLVENDTEDAPLSTWGKGADGIYRDNGGFGKTAKEKEEEARKGSKQKPYESYGGGWSERDTPPSGGYGNYQQYPGQSPTAYVSDRHKPTCVLAPVDEKEGWAIYAASRYLSDAAGMDLAIGCDNQGWTSGGNYKHTIPKELPELEIKVEPLKALVIKLDWPDQGAPPVPFDWWEKLYQLIQDRKWKVLFTCTGGHGRTGTAVACMYALAGIDKPIKEVRKHYCKSAVESLKQEDYIDDFVKYLNKKDKEGESK